MTVDRDERFTPSPELRLPGGEVFVGTNPTLIVASSFPVAVGSDGALYYPEVASDRRVQIMRLAESEGPETLTVLPVAQEIGPNGQIVEAEWIHGLAAGRNGSLYYSERHAVRRIALDGTVSTVADNIGVPECARPPAASEERFGPGLYGLDVAVDETIYVAAAACSALLRITQRGAVSVVLRASDAWSPMGVAASGDDLYVLEYRYIRTNRREDWLPRVRKVSSGARVTVVAEVRQR